MKYEINGKFCNLWRKTVAYFLEGEELGFYITNCASRKVGESQVCVNSLCEHTRDKEKRFMA